MAVTKKNASNLEAYFDKILDVFSDGIYMTDASGKTLKVNRMYEKQTGLKKEELIGRLVTDLKKEGIFNEALNPNIVKTGRPQTSVQLSKEGRKVVLNGNPVFDEKGDVAFVVTFTRDITVLSQLKDQITAQQELIDKYQQKFTYYENNKTSSLIAESPKMLNLLNMLKKVAKTDATVLLLGETGVGKDVLAHVIHKNSLRFNEPFFKVDCASIPENLIESELFGYAPGAFSGANTKGKPGFFELADKGTLFLDEIGELPLSMQSKLLRVLQDQEVMRVGSTKIKKVDVRFIAATNRNLEQAVKEGKFRSDLYYRLRVAVVDIPPLRQRKDDILPLASHFFDKYTSKYKKNMTFNKDVAKAFLRYNWPGNVREMQNLIQSLIVTKEEEILDICDLPNNMIKDECPSNTLFSSVANPEGRKLNEIMEDIEKKLIKQALDKHGTITAVANFFKVDRTTIFRKIKKYSLDTKDRQVNP